MEGSTSRSRAAADDLDSTVLRHQVERYFNELQQETDTPLNMDFLGIRKKRPGVSSSAISSHQQSSSSLLRTPAVEGFLPKKFRFETSAADGSLTDFSSTFASARRQTASSKGHEHEKQLAEKQAESLKLQQKVVELELKLSDLENAKSRLEGELDDVSSACRSQVRQCEDKIEDLMAEVEHLRAQNELLARESQERMERAQHWKLACAEEKLRLGRELTQAEQKFLETQSQLEEEVLRLKMELDTAECESNRLRLEVEESQTQLEQLQASSSSGPAPCDHQAVIDQQRQVIMAMENALFAQRAAASQSQEAKLAKIPQMEKEIAQLQQTNRLLRETAANELLLKEQISSLQSSLSRYKEQCLVIPELEGEMKKAKEHLREWENLARRLFDTESLPQVRLQVDDMRHRELRLTQEAGDLRAELNSAHRQISSLQEQVSSLKDSSKGRSELEERARKLERKLAVVQKDRDHYRAVNEMFESEMTRVGAPTIASKEALQIRELERLLDEYRTVISTGDGSAEAVAKDQQIAQLNKTIESLKAELVVVSSKGVSSDTRVLHFVCNPLDNARAMTVERLAQMEKENESLRERVRLMEAGQTQNLTLLVGEHFEQGCTPERLKELEEKLKLSELKNQRVEEVFRKYCSDFRRGIFELFGYQVDNDECGNFKLISVFSESSEDYLSFKYVGEGLVVMDSPYMHTIDDLVQTHITNQKSIPIFLASHQIDLFSRQQSINSSASMMLATPG